MQSSENPQNLTPQLATLRAHLVFIRSIMITESETNWIPGIETLLGEIDAVGVELTDKEALNNLKDTYAAMTRGKESFAEFFLWSEDFEERKALNEVLEYHVGYLNRILKR